jgi:Transglutaminase-like superfamily
VTASATAGPVCVDRAAVAAFLEKASRIPNEARTFDVPLSQARESFGIPLDVLELLTGLGLPHAGAGADVRYDSADLANVGLGLGYSPAGRAARRFWAAGLNRDAALGPVTYQLEYMTGCPEPGHRGDCHYRFAVPGMGIVPYDAGPDRRVRYRTTVSLEYDWPDFPPAERALLAEAAGLDLTFTPASLRCDLDFIRRQRICDCVGATTLLLSAAAAHGVQARWAFGLIGVPPFASVHHWVEISVDGRWVPADPVLVNAMLAWGVLDPAVWHPYRSPGSIFIHLADREVPIAVHGDVPVPVVPLLRSLEAAPAADDRH